MRPSAPARPFRVRPAVRPSVRLFRVRLVVVCGVYNRGFMRPSTPARPFRVRPAVRPPARPFRVCPAVRASARPFGLSRNLRLESRCRGCVLILDIFASKVRGGCIAARAEVQGGVY